MVPGTGTNIGRRHGAVAFRSDSPAQVSIFPFIIYDQGDTNSLLCLPTTAVLVTRLAVAYTGSLRRRVRFMKATISLKNTKIECLVSWFHGVLHPNSFVIQLHYAHYIAKYIFRLKHFGFTYFTYAGFK